MVTHPLAQKIEKKDIESIDVILPDGNENQHIGNGSVLSGNIKLVLEQENRTYTSDSAVVYNILAAVGNERYFLKFADINFDITPSQTLHELANELRKRKKAINVFPNDRRGQILGYK